MNNCANECRQHSSEGKTRKDEVKDTYIFLTLNLSVPRTSLVFQNIGCFLIEKTLLKSNLLIKKGAT